MNEEWSPYDEGEFHLPKYKHFFDRDVAAKEFGGYDDLEDWLIENCPENYCYTWIYGEDLNHNPIVVDQVVGVPENLVIAIKLITADQPFLYSDCTIRTEKAEHGGIIYRIHGYY